MPLPRAPLPFAQGGREYRVDYQLTPLGESLMRAVNAVKAWAEEHIAEIEASRTAHDQRAAGQPTR